MRINLEQVDRHLDINTDICIIGAGVAGQTLASQFKETSLKVTLLESGDHDFRHDVQDMAHGENIGEPYYALKNSRLRLFGGTAAIWGGRCAELDSIDFETRDYVPHSGWPISKADLDAYYDKSFEMLGLTRPQTTGLWSDLSTDAHKLDPQKLETGLWAFDEQGERFTNMRQRALENCDIILNATLTDFEKNEGGEITSITCQSLKNTALKVRAKIFVLATGAIETARILLAKGQGLGNRHDQLGRYFMEHPHARGGEVIPVNAAKAFKLLPRAIRHKDRRYAAFMRPSETLQRREGILNTSLSLTLRRREGEHMEGYRRSIDTLKHNLPSKRIWRSLYHNAKLVAVRGLEFTDPWSSIINMKLSGRKAGIFAVIRAEQAPNPLSRVRVSEALDSLGVQRAALDWQFKNIDRDTVRVTMETLAYEYQRLGWGNVKPSDWLYDEDVSWKTEPLISTHPIGGYHHMGGTRMSMSPKMGVVNADCKLHDSPNLYIAGSGVFPTGGWANPTITIMALALRLGGHLRQKLA